jgi:hypothetical protein
MDSAYDESDGSVEVSLARAHAWLKVIRSMSSTHGAPRMRNPSGPGWIGQKAVLMQAYATVMVRLSWHHVVGPATKVEWVISDSSYIFSPPPGADRSQGSWDIPVSTVGGNDPHNPSLVPQHDPRPVVLKCTVEDTAGQKVTVSRKVDPWYPASYFVPGTAMPLEAAETMDRMLDILPEVQERLFQSRAPSLPPELEGKLAEHIECDRRDGTDRGGRV